MLKKAIVCLLKEFLFHLRSHPSVPFRVGSPTTFECLSIDINCLTTNVEKLPLTVAP